ELPETKELLEMNLGEQKKKLGEEISFLEREIKTNPLEINDKDYHKSVQKFWDWLYGADHEAWIILDPVVSVQPDGVIFEAFSLDESMYGRVTLPQEQLELKETPQRGTTNIDFSQKLATEFDRVRSYRPLTLQVGQGAVEISTDLASRVEKKIDLPESWVNGFLEVQSASAFPKTSFNLSPTTVSNLIAVLEQHKDNVSPKSLRFILNPGEQPIIEIEPWAIKLKEPNHIFSGSKPQNFRVWGRKRLMVLKDMLPYASKVGVDLLGSGLPSFWKITSKEFQLDLGLSGWSSNDWASQAKFSLSSEGVEIDKQKLTRIAALLKGSDGLSISAATKLSGFSRKETATSFQQLCAKGQAMYDFHKKIYRWRELFPADFIPPSKTENPRLKKALKLIEQEKIAILNRTSEAEGVCVNGHTLQKSPQTISIRFDVDGRAIKSKCSCYEFKKTGLSKGPCEHLIALMKLNELEEENKNFNTELKQK
ncbi:MAG: SWIM zinc finger family protein, partial [Pseudomonadota bacterium]|nr:SWIM zinc finger family protein [Pseudomonadota bacterium]